MPKKSTSFKKLLCFLFLFISFSIQVRSQAISNYTFTASTATFVSLSPSPIVISAVTAGDLNSGRLSGIPIGFEFWYMGNRFTEVSASTNGFISFDNILTNNNYGAPNNLTNGIQRNVLAPLWDDLSLTGSTVSYMTSGTPGSRTFTIQFLSVRWDATANDGRMSFQIRLYESNGSIEFNYTQVNAGTALSNPSASIGINGPNAGTFRSVTSAGVLTTTETNNINTRPASNQRFTFVPTLLAAPAALTFSNVSQSGMTLNWQAVADATGYAIYKSSDGGATFAFESEVIGGVLSYTATGLDPNTSYVWRIYTVRESISPTTFRSGIQNTSFLFAYPFSGNALDVAGSNNNGTPQPFSGSPATLSTDRFGNANSAYSFDGVDDYISTSTSMNGPQVFSISIWFKSGVAGGKLIGFGSNQTGSSGSYDRQLYIGSDGKLYFGVYPGSVVTIPSINPVIDNKWHNAIAMMSSTGMKLYVDGVLQGTNPNTVAQSYSGFWRIGYDNTNGWTNIATNWWFNGSLDDIQISSYELSPAEIASLSSSAYANYGYTLPVTLNTSGIISGTQVNFPYLISIVDDNLKLSGDCDLSAPTPVFGKVTSSTGNDISFTDEFGAALSYDIEKYVPATGSLLVWVKLPFVSGSANKKLNILIGNPSAPANVSSNTWTADYKAVFHFNESTYSGSTVDATTTALVGTASNMNASNLITSGKVGNAYTYNGSNQQISVAASPVYAITGTSYTISAWINLSGAGNDQKVVTNQEIESVSNNDPDLPAKKGGYKIGLNNLIPESENRSTNGTTFSNRDTYPNVSGTSTKLNLNNWYYVQSVFNGDVVTTFVDGVERQRRSNSLPATSGRNLLIGVGEGGNLYWFNGIIDEVRISNIAKSTNWLLSEFRNQNNPSAITKGSIVANLSIASGFPGLIYTFTGNNTNFSTPGNWTSSIANVSGAPSGNFASIIIPAGKAPVLSADQSVYAISIANGSSLGLQGKILNVGCNVYNSGQILNSANSTLNFNGSIPSQQYFGSSVVTTLDNLSINNSSTGTVNISSNSRIDVLKLISITRGTLNTTGIGAGGVTLKSTASSNANIGPLISGTSDILGNLNIESWFTGGLNGSTTLQNYWRGTRLVSTPINDATLTTKTYKQLQSSMIITGNNGGGFDIGNSQRPYATTITKFIESTATQSFSPLTNINNPAPAGDGFFLFYRGDRSNYSVSGGFGVGTKIDAGSTTNQIYAVPESFAVTYTGPINKYTISRTIFNSNISGDIYNGYYALGNPYPSTISFSQFYNSNSGVIDNFVNIIKPGGAVATMSGGVYANWGSSAGDHSFDGYIQTGQGFYVKKSTAGSGTVNFSETHKLANINTPARLLSAPENSLGKITLMSADKTMGTLSPNISPQPVMRLSISNKLSYEETALVFGSGNSAGFGGYDAVHSTNNIVELSSISSDGKNLVINFLPEVEQIREVKLYVNNNETGEVKINFTDLTPVYDYRVILRDSYLGKDTDVLNKKEYSFTIDKSIEASYGAGRLSLIFERESQPYKLLSFTASKSGESAVLKWHTQHEKQTLSYDLEKSVDGVNFASLRMINASYVGSAFGDYNQTDVNTNKSVNYYRIKQFEPSGRVTYSSIESLDFSRSGLASQSFSVYPTIAERQINIKLDRSIQDNKVQVSIYNMVGNIVLSGSGTEHTVSQLPSGMYVVVVKDVVSGNQIGKSKFIRK